MLHQDFVTIKARVLDITLGEPLKVLLARLTTRPDGKHRMITLKPAVPEANLSARLLSEVNSGDEIDATVVTDWTEDGYSTHLSGYSNVMEAGSTISRISRGRVLPVGGHQRRMVHSGQFEEQLAATTLNDAFRRASVFAQSGNEKQIQ